MFNSIRSQDLEKLREEKKSLSKKAILALDQAMGRFATSAQFGILKHMKVAQFFKGRKVGVEELEGHDLDTLADWGTFRICSLDGMGQKKVELLTKVFEGLSQEEEEEEGAPSQIEEPAGAPMIGLNGNQAGYGSVEAENLLMDAYAKLKGSPDFERVKSLMIRDFWSAEDFVAAPFIESLTFGQLLEISIANLMKKKTFTDRKLDGIIAAIEKVLGVAPSQVTVIEPIVSKPKSTGLPSSMTTLLAGTKALLESVARGDGEFAEVAQVIIDSLEDDQLLVLWLTREYKPSVVATMLGCSLDEIAALERDGIEKLSSALKLSVGEGEKVVLSLLLRVVGES